MARQDQNAALAATSFLYGANAPYIEAMHARYARDPSSVDAEWRDFFEGLPDQPSGVEPGPSWQRRDWPVVANGELVAAMDGNWAALEQDLGKKIKAGVASRGAEISEKQVQQAARDSVRAIMMIRAYRMRGHFYARLDPLGLEPPKTESDLDPASYGFTEADFGRKIFIDHVLGLEFATIPEMLDILRRT